MKLVLIPSYNSGPKLYETVVGALQNWQDVWVVIDGSDDGSDLPLSHLDANGLRIIRRAVNGGKGSAILDGLRTAQECGFHDVLIMDGDGQHPVAEIPSFMTAAEQCPGAMILGIPRFDEAAPRIRVWGRKISNLLARLESGVPIGDVLFGFRVYPVQELRAVMESSRHMRGYDFDPEVVVRLSWRGVPWHHRVVPVYYFSAEEGGISHFHYLRDNLRLVAMHLRLLSLRLLQCIGVGRR
ncbi:glycosyltransferase family 2 protein [Acidithiobacillus sp. AMEEHan]|uniref:glycosyltransferase family 2 protein n=1 Tax=Acidithiobacillus sp. AMEEHan TaxID=2994951 RepID=UPI0027E4B7A3|nr:glycosyltransferase family 2 protein [Acidithiobacillus sp. AMEEHan]